MNREINETFISFTGGKQTPSSLVQIIVHAMIIFWKSYQTMKTGFAKIYTLAYFKQTITSSQQLFFI